MKTITHARLAEIYGKRKDNVKRTISSNGVKVIRKDKIRTKGRTEEVLIIEDCEHLHSLFSVRHAGSVEHGALCAIEHLKGIALIRQFSVSGFRIDGYDKENNIAYEIDESQHNTSLNSIFDNARESKIKKEINCEFVRIKV